MRICRVLSHSLLGFYCRLIYLYMCFVLHQFPICIGGNHECIYCRKNKNVYTMFVRVCYVLVLKTFTYLSITEYYIEKVYADRQTDSLNIHIFVPPSIQFSWKISKQF